MTPTTDRKFPTFLLTTLCVLLTLNVVVSLASTSHASTAEAQMYNNQPSSTPTNQPGLNGGAFNAARAVDQLVEVNQRLARIEARLDKGFNVKVTEMPSVTIANLPANTAKPEAEQPKP